MCGYKCIEFGDGCIIKRWLHLHYRLKESISDLETKFPQLTKLEEHDNEILYNQKRQFYIYACDASSIAFIFNKVGYGIDSR